MLKALSICVVLTASLIAEEELPELPEPPGTIIIDEEIIKSNSDLAMDLTYTLYS